MNPFGKTLLGAFTFLGAMIVNAQRDPHIAYVYPAGGRQGTSFEVIVAGRALAGPTNVYFSGGEIEAEILDYTRPMTGKEMAEAREQLRKLQEKKSTHDRANRRRGSQPMSGTNVVWTAEDERLLADLRRRLMNANKPKNPDTVEPVTMRIAIATNAAVGVREMRLRSAAGLSNPLLFEVGYLREFTEEPGAPDSRARYGRTTSNQPLKSAAEDEMDVSIPAALNGQIMPGGVDRFRFHARKGQRLVMSVHARALIPYFANAVPGWFQATLALSDANGKELAYEDDFRFNPDPVLYFEVPKDGSYVVGIKDALFRGREDFVYRLTVDEAPFITSVFPLGGKVGTAMAVEVEGWNLPSRKALVNASSVSVTNQIARSNELPFARDTLPEQFETEPNDSQGSAQKLQTPVIVNGRIDKPDDLDVFEVEAASEMEIVAEVNARRLGSPLDSFLTLTDENGHELAANDDFEDKGAGLVAHQADSYIRAKLPAAGRYFVEVRDTQHKGGREFAYRLRISQPQPDFALRVVPSSINLRGNGSGPITIYALRRDGFTNEIALKLKDAPEGFAFGGARIPADENNVEVRISARPRFASDEPVSLTFEGSADGVAGRLSRTAVPADDLMQAFAYHHLVPANELKALVIRWRPQQTAKANRN